MKKNEEKNLGDNENCSIFALAIEEQTIFKIQCPGFRVLNCLAGGGAWALLWLEAVPGDCDLQPW